MNLRDGLKKLLLCWRALRSATKPSSSNPCLDFFQRDRLDKKQIGSELRQISPDELCRWECLSASRFSPKPVDNEETVWRQIVDPTHWDRIKKTFTPNAFQDAETLGLSVNRSSYAKAEHLTQLAEDRVAKWNKENPEKPARSFLAFSVFNCACLRSITLTESCAGRLLYIFDTADVDNTSHADVFRLGGAEDKQVKRRARSLLYEIGMKSLRDRHCQPISSNQLVEIVTG